MLTGGKYHLNTEVVQYCHFRNENFSGLIILMGQVRNSGMRECCSTDLTICTPSFSSGHEWIPF
jgi:hypothetical protein